MHFITSFIGNPPIYWEICVKQIRLFSDDTIWCITNNIEHPNISSLKKYFNIFIVNYNDVRSSIFENVSSKHIDKFNYVERLKGREQLFLRSIERNFLCENLIKQQNLKDVIFLEIDNMIYSNPYTFLSELQKKKLAYMYDNIDRSSSGIMYIRDRESMAELNNGFIEFIKESKKFMCEMTYLYDFAIKFPNIVQYLPIHPADASYPLETYSEFDNYPCIFDGAPLGIYLFGRDPFHTAIVKKEVNILKVLSRKHISYINGEIVKGQKNPWSLIDFTVYKFEWIIDSLGRKCPWIIFSESLKKPIFNLHIHAKNLEEALSV